jgi:hypothetical protein
MLKEFTSGFLLYSYRGRGGPSGGPHMPWHSLALAQAVRPICVFFNLEGILVWNSNQHNCEVKLTTLRELKSELYIDGSHVHISKQLNGKRNPPHSATSIPYGKKNFFAPCRQSRALLCIGPTSASPVHMRYVEFLYSKRSSSMCF